MSSNLRTKPASPAVKQGNLAVVTGANVGIGKETTKQLVEWGCHVIMACRDVDKGEHARSDIVKALGKGHDRLEVMCLDLADLKSVKTFAHDLLAKDKDVQLLINNAGLMMPQTLMHTEQGHEIQMGTNHLGHFLLTNLLFDNISKCGGRVIVVSSHAHIWCTDVDILSVSKVDAKSYDKGYFYGLSKSANILFARELNRRFQLDALSRNTGSDVVMSAGAYSLHPGSINTALMRHNPMMKALSLFLMTAEQGAQTSLHLCAAPSMDLTGGGHYAECRDINVAPELTKNEVMQTKCWVDSVSLVKQYL